MAQDSIQTLLERLVIQMELQTRIMAEQVNLYAVVNRIPDFRIAFGPAPDATPDPTAETLEKAIKDEEAAREAEAKAEARAAQERAAEKAKAAAEEKAKLEAEEKAKAAAAAKAKPKTADGKEITKEMIMEAAKAYRAIEGTEALMDVLKKHSADNISSIKLEAYAEAYKDFGGK